MQLHTSHQKTRAFYRSGSCRRSFSHHWRSPPAVFIPHTTAFPLTPVQPDATRPHPSPGLTPPLGLGRSKFLHFRSPSSQLFYHIAWVRRKSLRTCTTAGRWTLFHLDARLSTDCSAPALPTVFCSAAKGIHFHLPNCMSFAVNQRAHLSQVPAAMPAVTML